MNLRGVFIDTFLLPLLFFLLEGDFLLPIYQEIPSIAQNYPMIVSCTNLISIDCLMNYQSINTSPRLVWIIQFHAPLNLLKILILIVSVLIFQFSL